MKILAFLYLEFCSLILKCWRKFYTDLKRRRSISGAEVADLDVGTFGISRCFEWMHVSDGGTFRMMGRFELRVVSNCGTLLMTGVVEWKVISNYGTDYICVHCPFKFNNLECQNNKDCPLIYIWRARFVQIISRPCTLPSKLARSNVAHLSAVIRAELLVWREESILVRWYFYSRIILLNSL